jgi:hypothetical protein
VDEKLKVTLSLDRMQVLEKLWRAAYVSDAEGSLEADLWVLDRALRILFGEAGQVVKGIRQIIIKRGMSGPKAKTLIATANYLYRNRPECAMTNTPPTVGRLPAGGPVEGACKNLIKDRMERSGMSWTEQMAEAVVQLRAIYLSEISIATGNSTSIRTSVVSIPRRLGRRSEVATPI